jgi:hypothetical protein
MTPKGESGFKTKEVLGFNIPGTDDRKVEAIQSFIFGN